MSYWEREERYVPAQSAVALQQYDNNPHASSYVNIADASSNEAFPVTLGGPSEVKDIFTTRHETTSLNALFFSAENVQKIIDNVRYAVFQATQRQVGMEPSEELQSVMNNVFEEHARYVPDHLDEQVTCLNRHVYDKIVPYMTNNVLQYDQYVIDKSSLFVPMPRSKNMSVKGRNAVRLNNPY